MEKNADYIILRSVLFDNRRGFALGQHESPRAPQPFVTWQFSQEGNRRDYYWGHYHSEEKDALRDFSDRAADYKRRFKVQELPQPQQKTYKYFSTQRPVDIGTYPKNAFNAPIEITNYDKRMLVEHDTRLAWGELTYAQPLTAGELSNYELRPSRYNPDVWERMNAQAQIVGKWEDAQKLPDPQRMTWWYPDFGSYVVKEHISPEQLDKRVEEIEAQRAAAEHKRKKAPISQQMKQAQKRAEAERGPSAPKKDVPDKGDR